jgi:multidrug resistance efflux pump
LPGLSGGDLGPAAPTAQVNLERTRIVSPVDGYVTNLLV